MCSRSYFIITGINKVNIFCLTWSNLNKFVGRINVTCCWHSFQYFSFWQTESRTLGPVIGWLNLAGENDFLSNALEISTRGHKYEKGYRFKNVVTLFRRQFPGKQQCWCQIWLRKSGIQVHTTYVWKVWCKSGQIFFKFWPLTLNDLDLTEMKPARAIPGSAYTHPYQGRPKDVGDIQMWPLSPNDLDLWRSKPLMGISGVSLHTRTNPVKCVPEAPHNPTPNIPSKLWGPLRCPT
jgi:hypothetical protein